MAVRAAALLGVILLWVLVALPASAHALFVRSVPEANAILARAPIQVELFVSEPLEAGLSSITVLDVNARPVDLRDTEIDPNNPIHMRVSLRSLSDGVYTVSWKAISATDGHASSGSFPFAVGNLEAGALAAAAPEKSQLQISPLGILTEWLLLAGLVVLNAWLPFTRLVWRPALGAALRSGAQLPDPPAWRTLAVASLCAVFVALAVDLLIQASQLAGPGFLAILGADTGAILLQTRIGLIWLLRLALSVWLAWLLFSQPKGWKAWGRLVGASLLLLSMALTSHAAADENPLLPVLVDWLHLAAISAWVGGLAFFVLALRPLRALDAVQRTAITSLLIARFSALALACVALTALTGVYTAAQRLGGLPALFGSLYGQALLLKLGLAGLMLGFGAINLLLISPRLKRDRLQGLANGRINGYFGRILLAEGTVGLLVLLGASLLAALPPAVAPTAASGRSFHAQVDDLQEDLNITPGRVGLNTFSLRLQAGGQALEAAKEVVLRFTAAQQDLPPSEIQLIARGNGLYEATGSYLSIPGVWQMQIIVRRADQFDAYANLDIDLQSAALTRPGQNNPRIAGGLLILIGMGFGLTARAALRSPRLRLGLSVAPAVLLGGLGVIFIFSPSQASPDTINPVVPNSASIQIGKALYTHNCLTCHGPEGKGDGPTGRTLNPRPADLSQHAVQGVHTDAKLFQWISQGYPGTPMGGFEASLSETERWNLVNYIRTLAVK